jgi:hypothetical protein
VTASIGVAVLIFTNLILLPILLSYIGVARKPRRGAQPAPGWPGARNGKRLAAVGLLARSRGAAGRHGRGGARWLLAAGGYAVSLHLKIGDLDPGAPELRPTRATTATTPTSPPLRCPARPVRGDGEDARRTAALRSYDTLVEVDRLAWQLQQVPGVEATNSMADAVRHGGPATKATRNGDDLLPQPGRAELWRAARRTRELFNTDCSVMPVIAYLSDHRAETLERVVGRVRALRADTHAEDRQFLLAAGSAGIEAATNIVVREGLDQMLLLVYAAVVRAVLHHLPQLARGGGGRAAAGDDLDPVRGADGGAGHRRQGGHAAGDRAGRGHRRRLRAVPVSVQLAQQRAGRPLAGAYRSALEFTGKVVVLVGVTLAVGVATWALVAHQVPGRHGHPAGLHVPVEHGRRAGADPGAVALPAARAAPQALVLNLGNEVLDALGRLPASAYDSVPSTVATLSTAGLTQLTRLFRNRLVGYTSVVPNPEVARLPIVRELERDADAFIGPEALTFEGLESYLNLRVCTEALRRAGPRADGQRLGEAIESLGALDLGGFRLSFGRERHHASDHVEIGMRARDGKLIR